MARGRPVTRCAQGSDDDRDERTLGDVLRNDTAHTLQVPSDGSVGSLKTRLDGESIDVDQLTVRTPHLDDVFLALTGQPQTETETTR